MFPIYRIYYLIKRHASKFHNTRPATGAGGSGVLPAVTLIPGEQTIMPKVYLKEADNPSRTEVAVESVENLAVKDFRATVSEKLDIPLEELCECFVVESPETVIGYILNVYVFISTCRRANSIISPTPSPYMLRRGTVLWLLVA